MTGYILGRIGSGLLVVLGVVLVVFLLFMVVPGDPARLSMGQRSDVATLEAVRRDMGLDQPRSIQLLSYINDLSPVSIHTHRPEKQEKYGYVRILPLGSKALVVKWPYLRRSYQSNQPVADLLMGALPNTIVLALAAFLLAAVLGIVFGVVAALYRGSWVESAVMVTANMGISLPSFFAAILIAWLFGYLWSRYTGLEMYGSLYEVDPVHGRQLALRNLVLPALALGIRPLAIIAQLTRSAMLEVLSQDYIRTATAKGLSRRTVIWKHGLRNALNPVLTAVSGWFASLLTGAFFIEFIFGWRGLGKITVDALMTNDFPVVMGSVLFIACIFVVVNIAVDLLYGVLDPRVRVRG